MLSPLLREVLACPVDHASVMIDDARGTVTCSQCGRIYPIVDGIPVMLESQARHGAQTPVSGIAVVEGVVKDYGWGRVDGLAAWVAPSGGPQAELWFGSHPAGPSPVIALHGRDVTDPDVTEITAPLLVKVLAINAPLSVQVHPDRSGIDRLHAAGRGDLLADDALKAELLIAMEPVRALAGLRSATHMADLLERLGIADAAAAAGSGDVTGALQMALGQTCDPQRWADTIASLPALDREILATVTTGFPEDRGHVAALLMRPWELAAGEALFVAPGTMHAYVSGMALEVMTSSDNVVRAGLTPKEVDVEAFLMALNPDQQPEFHSRPLESPRHYSGRTWPFTVREIRGHDDIAAGAGAGGTIVALTGAALISTPMRQVTVPRGHAGLVLGDGRWDVTVEGPDDWALVAHPA